MSRRPWPHPTERGRWINDWLSRATGGRIMRPFARDVLRRQLSRDAADNAASTPPPDGHVETLGIWAFEAFTPSNVEDVFAHMRGQGWATHFKHGSERDLVTWLRRMRREGQRGSHVAHFTRPEDRTAFTLGHDSHLPEFAELAVAEIVSLSSSISGIVVFFAARPASKGAIEAALRCDHTSTVEQHGRSVSVIKPDVSRRRAVERLRVEWRREIATWLRAHAPGAFSTGSDADFPMCELLVGDNFPLFQEPDAGESRSRVAATIDASFASWLFEEQAAGGLVFATNPCRADQLSAHAILAGPASRLREGVHQLGPDRTRNRGAFVAHDDFHDTFLKWSLLQLLEVYHRRTNLLRDQASRIFRSRYPLGALDRLQRFATTLGDAATVTRELAVLGASGFFHSFEGCDLYLRRWRPSEDLRHFLPVTREQLGARANSLAEATRELDAYLEAQGSLISARANLGLQLVVFVFAVLSLLLGAVSAYEAWGNIQHTRLREAAAQSAPADIQPTRPRANRSEDRASHARN